MNKKAIYHRKFPEKDTDDWNETNRWFSQREQHATRSTTVNICEGDFWDSAAPLYGPAVPRNNLRRLNAKRGGEKRPLKPRCFPDITLPQITCFVQMRARESLTTTMKNLGTLAKWTSVKWTFSTTRAEIVALEHYVHYRYYRASFISLSYLQCSLIGNAYKLFAHFSPTVVSAAILHFWVLNAL